jgi:hypothetical protein
MGVLDPEFSLQTPEEARPMRSKPTTFAHRAMFAALLTSAVALLALAGPVAGHGDGDHSGFDDDDPAGQIASFDSETGVLVIDLAEGGSISGLVTRRTWIKSDDDHCGERRHLSGWCSKRHHLSGSGNHHGWDHSSRGDTDDLVPGATVEDALVVLKDGRAFFWKIELEDD